MKQDNPLESQRRDRFTWYPGDLKRVGRTPAQRTTVLPEFHEGLLEEWADWEPGSPPFVLEDDREVLATSRSLNSILTLGSWHDAHNAANFCAPDDRHLHLGLTPLPFVGNMMHASIYILLLNPGLHPSDYYGEYEVPGFRKALLENLKQRIAPNRCPFIFLDPEFSWHSGFDWWHRKLSRVIEHLSRVWSVSFAEARRRLGSQLAAIELVPYHSANFHDADKWRDRLRSTALARFFVNRHVLPRVREGDTIAIVTRQVRHWRLEDLSGVVTYSGTQSRAAHMSPGSPGGQAIIRHLLAR